MILSLKKAKELLKKELSEVNKKLGYVASDDQKILQEQNRIKAWIFRKSYPHPYRVYQCVQDLKKEPEILSKIEELGISKDKFSRIADINAYLHDIGRLREVDFKTGLFLDDKLKKETNFTHANESYNMLKEFGIKDVNILLPIKYHDAKNFYESLNKDENFLKLSDEDKKTVCFFGDILTDADKMSNILEVSTKGLEGRLEMFDPKYKPEASISPKVKEAIFNGQNPNKNDENTRADALVRFATWTNNLSFEASKNVAVNYLDGIFKYVKAEKGNGSESASFEKDILDIYNYLSRKSNRTNINAINVTKDRS